MQKLPGQNYPMRATVGVLLLLGGFVFPLLFIFGGLVLFALFNDLRDPGKPEDHPFYDPKLASADDPAWRDVWMGICESPAETAFLRSMIDHYALLPKGGKLVGAGLVLDLQVEVDCYRVDFLANQRHVIEIDGAAYHTGEYEEARDAYRDAVLAQHGYRVLRIPAKIALNHPHEALRRVRHYVADLSMPVVGPLPQKPLTAFERMIERNLAASRAARKAAPGQTTSMDPWPTRDDLHNRGETAAPTRGDVPSFSVGDDLASKDEAALSARVLFGELRSSSASALDANELFSDLGRPVRSILGESRAKKDAPATGTENNSPSKGAS